MNGSVICLDNFQALSSRQRLLLSPQEEILGYIEPGQMADFKHLLSDFGSKSSTDVVARKIDTLDLGDAH